MRRRVTVVGSVCVCLSVKSHLTSGAFVCPETTVMYSTGNRGQKICGFFSKNALFKNYGVICLLKPPTTLMHSFSMTEPSKVL